MSLLAVAGTIAATGALAQRGRIEEPTGNAVVGTNETVADTVPPTILEEAPITLPIDRELDETVVPVSPVGRGLLAADLGCIDDLSAESIDRLMRGRMGASLAIDNPHVTELGDDRYVWVFHDAFLDYTGESSTIDVRKGEALYLENVALLQEGRCFQMIHRGSVAVPRPFERPGLLPARHFLWPLGGGIGADGNLYMFWSELQQDESPGPGDGILRHPVATWLAAYDPNTLARLNMERAPNDGVSPQYGTAVQTQGRYTYLFGNSNMLNLDREAGGKSHERDSYWRQEPFSGSREYLARVPAGEFDTDPEYYTNSGWSSDPDDARPISERFRISNSIQPRLVNGRWYSVVKENEWWGNRLVIDTATKPWGPWETVHDDDDFTPITPRGADPERIGTYQPILLPWRDPGGGLIVVVSQHAISWAESVKDPRTYRPRAFAIDVD